MKTVLGVVTLAFVATAAGCGKKQPSGASGGGGTGGSGAAAIDAGSGGAASDAGEPGSGSAAGSGSGSAAGSGSGSGSAAGSGSGSAAGSAAADPARARTAVQEGAACPQGLRRVDDVPITITGATVSFKRSRGGGCPQRPSYVAVFAKASPMPVMVCFDAQADLCEMFLQDEPVSIDLSDALKTAGATAVVAAK